MTKFYTAESFIADCEANVSFYNQGSWTGDIGSVEAIELTKHGDSKLVEQAQKYLDKLPNLHPESRAWAWIPSVAGAYPVVPEYLANSPTSMRLRRKMIRETAPVNIYVSTTCSAGITQSQVMTRGLAVLALLMQLERFRPVNLYCLVELGKSHWTNYIACIQVPSQPLAISQAAFMLAHSGFIRGLTYHLAEQQGGSTGSWPYEYYHRGGMSASTEYMNWLRETVGASDEDVFVPSAHVHNICDNPVEWIEKMLKRTMCGESMDDCADRMEYA